MDKQQRDAVARVAATEHWIGLRRVFKPPAMGTPVMAVLSQSPLCYVRGRNAGYDEEWRGPPLGIWMDVR
jgi:hypothetical protein